MRSDTAGKPHIAPAAGAIYGRGGPRSSCIRSSKRPCAVMAIVACVSDGGVGQEDRVDDLSLQGVRRSGTAGTATAITRLS